MISYPHIISFYIVISIVFSQHNFSFTPTNFLLDGEPFQIFSGEMHYARIPPEYWSHRLKLAKAMGLNTIATYVFWNFHQKNEFPVFDFETPSHDLGRFIRLAQEEGLYVLLRPGPYVCSEWDFGGLPFWLLKHEDLKPRSYDKKYLGFVERYFKNLAEIIVPLQITQNGPILMLQIENEFGSFGLDPEYLLALKKMWLDLGITVPFYTADDGDYPSLSHGHVPGAALGIDPGSSDDAYNVAKSVDPNVITFSAETYPGWETHWGEQWANVTIDNIMKQMEYILSHGRSFNLYMVHGGTNWGFWAGADPEGTGFEPHITSYDYDAPITENGNVTEKYFALRSIISKYSKNKNIPEPPEPFPTISFPKVELKPLTDIWEISEKSWFHNKYPLNFESLNQFSGLIIYRTYLKTLREGLLNVEGLRDYGLVFADEIFIGVLDRAHKIFEIELPKCSKIEIVVEGMGRLNYGPNVRDLKGIISNVTLNGETLEEWDMASLPLEIFRILEEKKLMEVHFRKKEFSIVENLF